MKKSIATGLLWGLALGLLMIGLCLALFACQPSAPIETTICHRDTCYVINGGDTIFIFIQKR